MTRPPARMSAVMWRCRSAKPWTPSRPAALASAGVCAAIASATSAPVASLLTWRRILLAAQRPNSRRGPWTRAESTVVLLEEATARVRAPLDDQPDSLQPVPAHTLELDHLAVREPRSSAVALRLDVLDLRACERQPVGRRRRRAVRDRPWAWAHAGKPLAGGLAHVLAVRKVGAN